MQARYRLTFTPYWGMAGRKGIHGLTTKQDHTFGRTLPIRASDKIGLVVSEGLDGEPHPVDRLDVDDPP